MKKTFNIFLDSSCPISKRLYSNNTATEFTIELPERMSFRRNWSVTLKSLFIPNKINYVDGCYLKYFYYNWSLFDEKKNAVLKLVPKHCSSIEEFLDQFNLALLIFKIKIRATIINGKVKLEYYEEWEK